MASVARFTVSIEDELLKSFDEYCSHENIATRSEAVRQLIHEKLTDYGWHAEAKDSVATLTVVYDHHRAQLVDRLMYLQHEHAESVVSTLHVHLDHSNCLEVIVLRGRADRLRRLANQLKGLKGIQQGHLVIARAEASSSHSH